MGRDIADSLSDRKIRHDISLMGDFVSIWCDANHESLPRRRVETDAAGHGVYGRYPPLLCGECESHLAYAERRRALCPKSPKPYCAHCDSQCYASAESEWQRQMMRFSGPKSWRRVHIMDGVKHMFSTISYRRRMRTMTAVAGEGAASKEGIAE